MVRPAREAWARSLLRIRANRPLKIRANRLLRHYSSKMFIRRSGGIFTIVENNWLLTVLLHVQPIRRCLRRIWLAWPSRVAAFAAPPFAWGYCRNWTG